MSHPIRCGCARCQREPRQPLDLCSACGYSRGGHWSNEPRCPDFVETPAEPSPNGRARDAAVALLKGALDCGPSDRVCNQIRTALIHLEAIK